MSETLIELTGTLLQDAEVRTRPMGDDATPCPVLRLVLRCPPSTTPVACEQIYPPSHRAQAEHASKALRKGLRVTVAAPISSIRTTLTRCCRVDVLPADFPSPTAPQKELHV